MSREKGDVRRESRVLLGLSLVTALVSLAPHALAHNAVVNSQPAPNSVVEQSPITVRITTSDQLLDLGGAQRGFGIAVQDSTGLYYGDGCVQIDATSLGATVSLGDAGVYRLTYQYVSADGHSLSDQYSFTFRPHPAHQPAPGAPDPPFCAEVSERGDPEMPETSAPSATENARPDAHFAPQQASNPWLIGSGFAVAGLAVVSLLLLFARRRSQF